MNHTPFAIWCAILTVLLVGIAVFTDLRWRRIPNILTFSAFTIAVAGRLAVQGMPGLGLALGGAVAAPLLLSLLHGGRGLGMGDLKLAAAIGAILGPMLGLVTMLLSAVAGGMLAIAIMARPGGSLYPLISVLSIGIPKFRRAKAAGDVVAPAKPLTMPYGVALAVGSLATLTVCWLTGDNLWILSFVGFPTGS